MDNKNTPSDINTSDTSAKQDDCVVVIVVFRGRNRIVDKLGLDDVLPLPLALLLLALYRRTVDAHQIPTYLPSRLADAS